MNKRVISLLFLTLMLAPLLSFAETDQRSLKVLGTIILGEPVDFMRSHPDVKLDWSTNVYTAEEVYKKILAKDSSIDIYNVAVNNGFRKLVDKGFLPSLDKSRLISDDVNSMYPNIKKTLIDKEGNIIAWPTSFSVDKPQISCELWKLAFGERPYPVTCSDLLDAMILWEQGIAEDLDEIEFDMNFDHAWFAQYIVDAFIQSTEAQEKPVNLLDERLRSLLEKLEKVRFLREQRGKNTDRITDYGFEPKPFIFDPGFYSAVFTGDEQKAFIELSQFFVYGVNPGRTVSIPLKIDEEDEYYRGRMTVWIINPYSKNIDLSLEFIEQEIDINKAPELYYALHPNANKPYPYSHFEQMIKNAKTRQHEIEQAIKNAEGAQLTNLQDQLKYYNEWLNNIENEKWRISEKSIKEYRQIADKICFFENSQLLYLKESSVDDTYKLMFKRYAQKQLSLQQLLEQLNEKVKLMILEQ
ncbi:MAG: hypothetical protein ACOYIT_04405 [Christensenellales bacterium]|jgi:hypothetical protein